MSIFFSLSSSSSSSSSLSRQGHNVMSDVRAKWLPRLGQTREQKTKWLQCSVCDCAVNRGEAKTLFFAFCTFSISYFFRFLFFLLWTNKRKKDKVVARGYLHSAVNDNMGANVNRKYSCTCKCFIC